MKECKTEMWLYHTGGHVKTGKLAINTLRTGDADLRFYITTVQDG